MCQLKLAANKKYTSNKLGYWWSKASFSPKTGQQYQGLPASHPAMKKAAKAVKFTKKGPRSEMKRPEQILKEREKQEKIRARNERQGKKKGGKKKGRR